MKKLLFLISVLLMCTAATTVFAQENLIKHSAGDFTGELTGMDFTDEQELTLSPEATEGTYISPEIETAAFKNLVASWVATTSQDSSITLSVRIQQYGQWSKWLSYGTFSNGGRKASASNQKDAIASINIDTVIASKSNAGALQYKVVLQRADGATAAPVLRQVALALDLVDKSGAGRTDAADLPESVDLPVPERSQMIVPKIGSIICSPTSLSMLLEYNGVYEETAAVAANVKDTKAGIYGNWTFNMAYAGEKQLNSYVERGVTVNDIKKHLANGTAVALSVKGSKKITNAPSAYPSGHLIVARGYETIDGVEYIIVNDPAAPNNDSVKRYYPAEELEGIWQKIMYVVEGDRAVYTFEKPMEAE